MSDIRASFFDSFNARFLDAEEVARSFVPSSHFEELACADHALLVGPRGSGKTTLLKMLKPEALTAWAHPQGNSYRGKINYTGVFIPADISWGAQLEALGYGRLDNEHHTALSLAAFTTHVFQALTSAMIVRTTRRKGGLRIFRYVKLTSADEADLVRAIGGAWRLEPAIPSLLALKQALAGRLLDIGTMANRGALQSREAFGDLIFQNEWLHLGFIEGVTTAIEAFNALAGQPAGKWALLFDEVEIAPSWIQDQMMRALRSVDQRILIKLAISPVSTSARLLLRDELSPAGREDVRQIQLWNAEKQQGYRFCEDLWASLVARRGLGELDPTVALGPSYFDPDGSGRQSEQAPYRIGGEWSKRFAALAAKDASFQQYLQGEGIDAANLDAADVPTRDRVVRKVAPIVAVREHFRAADKSGQKLRSRKADSIYAGAESLFAISEGNPRWFIGMITHLLDKAEAPRYLISVSSQASEIKASAERFMAMIRTIPTDLGNAVAEKNPLTMLLEMIGRYFHSRIVLESFSPDPPLCFVVDASVDRQTIRLLEILLNRGAIVYIPSPGATVALPSIENCRFRLSYLLSARFHLPLRLGKDIKLSTIMNAGDQYSGSLF